MGTDRGTGNYCGKEKREEEPCGPDLPQTYQSNSLKYKNSPERTRVG
jgi:hypothetical protein